MRYVLCSYRYFLLRQMIVSLFCFKGWAPRVRCEILSHYFINFVVSTTDLLPTISQIDKTTAQSATAYTTCNLQLQSSIQKRHRTMKQIPKLVYYIQSPDGCTIMSPDNQVPCRNPDGYVHGYQRFTEYIDVTL